MEDNNKKEIKNGKSNSGKTKPNVADINNSIKFMLPRDVQNANSLIFSQINLNKYSWEVQGENVSKF
jgi:hypothetical protein